jgi:divalent metal cation (Fe/Co/Zn/Cd) transporter
LLRSYLIFAVLELPHPTSRPRLWKWTEVPCVRLFEKRALKIVGICFFGLAAYIGYESVSGIWSRRAPEHSIPGIVLACVSLFVMPLLSRAKRKVGRALASAALQADAKQTEFCTYLSAILLTGLLLNALWGFWWADPAVALLMVPIIAKEGFEGLQGKGCDECSRR